MLSVFEFWNRHCRRYHRKHHHHHKHRGTARFAGAYWIDQETGDIIVAIQTVPGSTDITAPLIFTDSATGNPVKGPMGQVTASDGSAVSLSADGQAVNYHTNPSPSTVILTWHDPAGNFSDAVVTLTDAVIPVTGTTEFGTFVPGTTP